MTTRSPRMMETRSGRLAAAFTVALLAAVMAAGCGGSSRKSAGSGSGATTATTAPAADSGATGVAAATTIPPPPRTVKLPTDPCSVLSTSEVATFLPGSTPVPRTLIQSASGSTAACSWRWGSNTLNVELTKNSAKDPFLFRAALLKNPQPVSGLGDQAFESDNLSTPAQSKSVVVLVRDGDLAIEVTAHMAGKVTLAYVEAATSAVIAHL
jgi:hypothetical protein